ncbi:MAG: hypothetical protein IPM57_08460 [Oligoflexia bacterium]|nr:hypothetical protein [Oligoflexia bacterium]
MAKLSIDVKEIKNNLKTTAKIAGRQVEEFAKKAQKDILKSDLVQKAEKLLEEIKNVKVDDILNNPQVKKILNNPKVQEFIKHEKVQEIINNPKVKEVTGKLTARAKAVKTRVKKVAKTRKKSKATASSNASTQN